MARLLDRQPGPLTGRELAERAGLSLEDTDPCPCLCGNSYGTDGPDCAMGDDIAALLAELTVPDVPELAKAA